MFFSTAASCGGIVGAGRGRSGGADGCWNALGTLYDGANGTPVRGALVEVAGTGLRAETDLDGKYRLQVAAGRYTVKFTAPNYLPAAIEDVVVVGGANTDASTVVVTAASVTTVEVTESISAVAATSEMVTQERKLAAAVSDGISGEEIRSSTASDAAGAMQQVTGVSIVESGYVYVRGLGERYSATMLNNAMIPTTEPERRVVPLDLFPAALIDNIKVLSVHRTAGRVLGGAGADVDDRVSDEGGVPGQRVDGDQYGDEFQALRDVPGRGQGHFRV